MKQEMLSLISMRRLTNSYYKNWARPQSIGFSDSRTQSETISICFPTDSFIWWWSSSLPRQRPTLSLIRWGIGTFVSVSAISRWSRRWSSTSHSCRTSDFWGSKSKGYSSISHISSTTSTTYTLCSVPVEEVDPTFVQLNKHSWSLVGTKIKSENAWISIPSKNLDWRKEYSRGLSCTPIS